MFFRRTRRLLKRDRDYLKGGASEIGSVFESFLSQIRQLPRLIPAAIKAGINPPPVPAQHRSACRISAAVGVFLTLFLLYDLGWMIANLQVFNAVSVSILLVPTFIFTAWQMLRLRSGRDV